MLLNFADVTCCSFELFPYCLADRGGVFTIADAFDCRNSRRSGSGRRLHSSVFLRKFFAIPGSLQPSKSLRVLRALTPVIDDTADDTDLVDRRLPQTATHFFSVGNCRMRLARRLLYVEYRKQRDKDNEERFEWLAQ